MSLPPIENAPDEELRRSPAAARVGALAAASGLLAAHFERRAWLGWPEGWEAPGRPDLGEVRGWVDGVLPETKYKQFQLERRIASFHPGHQPKWTAHELVHSLVGYAWKPGASLLWHATAARLSELLPVALWYHFDEAGLRRCPDHALGSPLYDAGCAACDAEARRGPVEDPEAERHTEAGFAFLERELAAVARTRREGRPIPHRAATLDLCSDGLAYAAAHGRRLNSKTFARWTELFGGPGWHRDLDSLEARIWEVAAHLSGRGEAAPLAGDRWRWIAQDLGSRLLQVRAETGGGAGRALDRLVEALAGAPTEGGILAATQGYQDLSEAWELPDPDVILGVGYRLPGGGGAAVAQIWEGLESAVPVTMATLGGLAEGQVRAFCAADGAARRGLGLRFADHLGAHGPADIADLARVEAALTHAPAPSPADATLGAAGAGEAGWRVPAEVALITVSVDVSSAVDDLDAPLDPLDAPVTWGIRRTPEGGRVAERLSPKAAVALRRLQAVPGPLADLGARERRMLADLGLILPERWAI